MDDLLFLSKNDIPFVEAQVSIHQPTISEISFISEETFFSACNLLFFSKDKMNAEDKVGLEDKSDFDILMSIVNNDEGRKYKNNIIMLLTLLFPSHNIKITNSDIILFSAETSARINNMNYNAFKDIVNKMFGLDEIDSKSDYAPADKRAEKIAEKLRRAKEKKVKEKDETKKVAVFSNYVSILAVGERKDLNSLMDYTVYQLKDEFKRFQMKEAYDMYIKAKMAGAQDLDEVDNWMDNIHS